MGLAVFATKAGTAFTCPTCQQVVSRSVVCPLGQVFTAPAIALHRGLGHTLALVGTELAVRCGDERLLVPLDAYKLTPQGTVVPVTPIGVKAPEGKGSR